MLFYSIRQAMDDETAPANTLPKHRGTHHQLLLRELRVKVWISVRGGHSPQLHSCKKKR